MSAPNTATHVHFVPDPILRARELTAAFRAQHSIIILGTAAPDGLPDASVAASLLDADILLYHQDRDHHGGLPGGIKRECQQTDQPAAALVADLKARGMLDDTLVVWGGEFGRTNYCQGQMTANNFGRDHHPRCFSLWLAGGGVKPGVTYGETDDYGYYITKDPVHIHDLHATILHLFGVDHERLTYKFQGRCYRLTDVFGKVVKGVLS